MEWILASASPRRKELLGEVLKIFEIIPAKGEENGYGKTGAELVETLAVQKAQEVFALPKAKGKAVLGADTVVCFQGKVLGKPSCKKEAEEMLSALSGREHEVFTGVCVIYPTGEKDVFSDCSKVRFRTLTNEEILAYIDTGSPMDKAGAYGIQDSGFVQSVEGSFSNVVGLPVEKCKERLKR